MIANRCARKKWHARYAGISLSEDGIEDATSDILEAYYALSEYERPQTEIEFEYFSFERARVSLNKEFLHENRMKRGKIHSEGGHRFVSKFAPSDSDYDTIDYMAIRRSGSVGHIQQPTQLIYLYLQDLMKSLEAAPEEIRMAASRLADAGTIIEYARDHNMSLFDAMNEQKRLREITKRIREDIADEKKFG